MIEFEAVESRSKRVRRAILRSKWRTPGPELLKQAIQRKTYPVVCSAFSGGEDSLAATLLTLDILQELGVKHRAYIVFHNTTNEFPINIKYVHEVFKWIPENYPTLDIRCVETKPKTSFSKLAPEMFKVAVEMYGKHWDKSKLTCCDILKLKPAVEFLKTHPINIWVTGIRGDESRQRFLALMKHGPIQRYIHHHVTKPGLVKIQPIWDWSKEDVRRYVRDHPKQPPLNPLYFKLCSIGCMLCPVPFVFDLKMVQRTYPREVYEAGLKLLHRARGQQPLM